MSHRKTDDVADSIGAALLWLFTAAAGFVLGAAAWLWPEPLAAIFFGVLLVAAVIALCFIIVRIFQWTGLP